ncbi:MAG: DUF58 domain-containing protein [Bacilli bacterium]|nr:DUF58 domain-containing protein [Bacilli bacterium]
MEYFAINEEFLQQVETLQLLLKNNVAGMFGGTHQSKTFGSSCDFADYREYRAGDDITKIDWNAYARFEKLYLKLYLDERQTITRIYIDASRSMNFGKGTKAVKALQLAATFAYISICNMDKVSIYVIQEKGVETLISNMLGKESFYNEILKLNTIDFEGDTFISQSILPTKVGYGDGYSILISDFLTPNDYEAAIDLFASKKRDIMCCQVMSNEELNPAQRGKVLLFDSENHDRTYKKNINRDVLRAYREAIEYITNGMRTLCQSRGGQYMLVTPETNMQELFLAKLPEMEVVK